MRKFTSFISGVMMGALVGSVIALLYAPSSGEELQLRAKDRISSLREEIIEAYEARVAQLETELAALRERTAKEE